MDREVLRENLKQHGLCAIARSIVAERKGEWNRQRRYDREAIGYAELSNLVESFPVYYIKTRTGRLRFLKG